MIRPRLSKVASGTKLTTDLVNGIINRTEYAADLLRQYKLAAGNGMYVEPHYDGTRVSYFYPVGAGATPQDSPIVKPTPAYRICGEYMIAGVQRGFVYDGSTYTDMMVPGSSLTNAYGIDGNNIVGIYVIGGVQKGFLYNGLTFTDITVTFSDSSATYPFGIDGNNIVGRYNIPNSRVRAFSYNGTTYTSLNLPMTSDVEVATDVNGNNIVGINGEKSFLYNGINFTDIIYPGAQSTAATGIDKTNIVGWYDKGVENRKGFIYDGSTFSTIAVPNSTYTEPAKILGNNIVGFYIKNNIQTGFLFNGSSYTDIFYPNSDLTRALGIG